ncbi:MAG: hypothetical protein M1828_000579 [Chrysothrix sp. TS-e1954]|nr:MAG: hypothetical protein M1828_000579 [Chrysothrix sp. TS-e1954]
MSSYADIASHGPSQTDEEKRAPAQAQLDPHDDSSQRSTSFPDVDSPHISSIPSNSDSSSLKTSTQSMREDRDNAAADVISMSDNTTGSSSSSSGKNKQRASETKDAARKTAAEAQAKAHELSDRVQGRTGQNPIALGNMVLGGVLATVLGVNVYQRWQSGEGFGGRFVAGWVGVVAAVGLGDFVVSRWAGGRGYGN